MPKKSIPTAESVYILFQQLTTLERNKFMEMTKWNSVADQLLKAIGALIATKEKNEKKLKAQVDNILSLKGNRFRSEEKHQHWRQLRNEGKSWAAIQKIHKQETGESVTIRAITSAVKGK